MADSIDDVVADAHEVFRYDREVRPQDRAHAYLARNRVRRGYDDTAMECVAVDLVRRAHELGEGGEAAANALRQFEAIERVARAGIDALTNEEEE